MICDKIPLGLRTTTKLRRSPDTIWKRWNYNNAAAPSFIQQIITDRSNLKSTKRGLEPWGFEETNGKGCSLQFLRGMGRWDYWKTSQKRSLKEKEERIWKKQRKNFGSAFRIEYKESFGLYQRRIKKETCK